MFSHCLLSTVDIEACFISRYCVVDCCYQEQFQRIFHTLKLISGSSCIKRICRSRALLIETFTALKNEACCETKAPMFLSFQLSRTFMHKENEIEMIL